MVNPSPWRRAALRTLAAGLLLPLSAPTRAGFNFFTSEYTASRAELQAQVEKRFPVQARYAELFQVALRQPVLSLDAAHNRAAIAAQLAIDSPLLPAGPVTGVVMLSSGLGYDREARAIRLREPRTERVELAGLGGRDAERLQRIAAVVAQELLRDQPLHSFTRDELTLGRKTYEIGDITVQADGITVQLL